MAIVEINNQAKPVAIGLDWHLLPGATSERKEIDALVKRTGAKFGCVVTEEAGSTMVGLSLDKKDGVHCGAAWLARASQGASMVLVEPLPDGRIWLCAVRAGLPVQDMDIVIDPAHLQERLRDFVLDGTVDVRLCSTLENLDQVYPQVSPQSFAELVANIKAERVRRISGVSPILTGSVCAALVMVAGWYGVDGYTASVKKQAAKMRLEQMSAQQKADQAEQTAAAKRAHIAAGQQKIRQVVLDKPAVSDIIDAYLAMLTPKPLTVAGYLLMGYDCTQLSCTLTWHRGSRGTILDFLKAAEKNGWTVGTAKGDDATTLHQVAAPPRTADIDDLSEDRPFRAALESKLQQAGVSGISYSLSESESLDKQMVTTSAVASPGVAPGVAPVVFEPLPYSVGTLTVKGSTIFSLRELPDYIAHAGMSVKNVRGDLKSNQWTLELNYATR